MFWMQVAAAYIPRSSAVPVSIYVLCVEFWVFIGNQAAVTFKIKLQFVLLPCIIQSSFKNVVGG